MTLPVERSRSRRPVTWRTLLGVLLLPAVIGGILVGALYTPTDRLENITAAIVNDDKAVELDGQLVPLGRQLTGGLVKGADDQPSNIDWVISNDSDAAAGLADGTYTAVVTIPENFTAASLSTRPGETPEKATIGVVTAPNARVVDGAITATLASTATSVYGSELSSQYLKNVFLGFTQLSDQLGQAAGGAHQLADGAGQAASGANTLRDGLGQLSGGAGQLSNGVGQLATGAGSLSGGVGQLATGAEQLSGGVGQLATGADQLADGTGQLATGADQLADGTGQLATGADGLAAGTDKLATGANDLAAGAGTLSGGIDDLASGADQLSDGATQLADGTRDAASGVGDLATGADTIAAGNRELATQVGRIADAIPPGFEQTAKDVAAAAPQVNDALGTAAADLQRLADECDATATPDLCAQLRAASDRTNAELPRAQQTVTDIGRIAGQAAELPAGVRAIADANAQLADGAEGLAAGARTAETGLNTIAGGVDGLSSGASSLGTGARQLSTGATELGSGASQLAGGLGQTRDGAAQLADGARSAAGGASQLAGGLGQTRDGAVRLADGAQTAAGGAGQLASGARTAADGAGQLASGAQDAAGGAGQLASGASDAATGAGQLADGVGQVASGTSSLAGGLDSAVAQIPSYTDAQATSLADVVADPVSATGVSDSLFGLAAVPLLAMAVLWFGGLASFVAFQAVSARALTSRRPSALVALRGFAPAALVGVVQGLLVAGVVQVASKYDWGDWALFALVCVAAGVAFAAVHQALVALFGGAGRWVAAIIGTLALGAGIVSTVPPVLAALASVLPTSPAYNAMLGALSSVGGVGAGVVGLLVWAVLALVVTTLVVVRRRTTSARAALAAA